MTIGPMTTVRDRLPSFIDRQWEQMCVLVSTTVVRAIAMWRGIELARGCQCFGVPILRRAPGSRVTIGGQCTFRSSRTSNLAGLNRPCYVSTLASGARVAIGKNCGFSGTVIGAAKHIVIGDHVMCGANTMITDTDWHAVDALARTTGSEAAAEAVVIHDNVWLGMDVIVLKGVTIGENSIIGAASVVTKSIPANVIAAGHPAKVIRCLTGEIDTSLVDKVTDTQP